MPHHHTHGQVRNLRTAFILNFGFTILEIVGGIWTNSVAILSDAVHDLGDSISLGLAWRFERVAQKAHDQRFSYGYQRFSLLSALLNTLILLLGSIVVLIEAIPRFLQPEPANAPGMVLFAVIGITVNGLAVIRLRHDSSLNAKAVAWHLLEDVLGWVAVLVVSILMVWIDLPILDPLLSVLITLYILINVFSNLRKTLALFLQAVPEDLNLADIESQLARIEQVRSTHHTHVWSLDGVNHVLTAHVVVDPNLDKDQVLCLKREIRQILRPFQLSHITVEIEYGDSDCIMAH